MNRIVPGYTLLFLFLYIQVKESSGDGKLSIKFIRYENRFRYKYNAQCCDGEFRFGQCTGGCDHKIRVCIDHIDSVQDIETCPLGRYELGGVAFDEGTFDFPQLFLSGLPNPFPINMATWEGGVQIKVIIYDEDTGVNELIDDFRFNYTESAPAVGWTSPPADYSDTMEITGLRPSFPSKLNLAVEVYCDTNFYGTECSINCVSEDDCQGHYICNKTTGEKLCLPGWSGSDCATRILGFLDCLPTQSCNHGTCVPQGQGSQLYYCCCGDGYTGDQCNIDVDECLSTPCSNNGSCIQDRPASFLCVCQSAYSGQTCERRKTCGDEPCQNGGLCIPEKDSFRCVCLSDYTGEVCENLITSSTRPTTPASTIPTTITQEPLLFCPDYFYGPDCSVYCRTDVSCTSGFYTCEPKTGKKLCNEGWEGADCNIRIADFDPDTECPESSCRNGAFCKNFTCCCAPGFTGKLCHIEILECDSSPCINGGRCRDRIAYYTCDCADGFTGKNCELVTTPTGPTTPAVDSCSFVSCANGGTCYIDENVRTVCLCPKGFTGSLCQEATQVIGNPDCPENRYGELCDVLCTPQDSCDAGHYECHNRTGERVCYAGWGGNYCTDRVFSPTTDPECPKDQCRNGGQCNNGLCCCPNGYSGDYCEEEIIECNTRPCLNGGECIDLIGSFSCICANGYTGELCGTLLGTSVGISTPSSSLETTSAIDGVTSANVVSSTTDSVAIESTSSSTSPASTTEEILSTQSTQVSTTTTTTTEAFVPLIISFVDTVYFINWWRFLREEQIIAVLQYATSLANAERRLRQEDIRLTVLGKWDNLNPAGRNVAELMYNVSLPAGMTGPLLPPTEQILRQAITESRYRGITLYTGLQSWRYVYHYDFYYRDGDLGDMNTITENLRMAWFEKYPEYRTCGCEFTIRIPRRVKYLDYKGNVVTRYIYFVHVDGILNDPVVRPGPDISELNTFFERPDNKDGIVAAGNLTRYDGYHVVYINGNENETESVLLADFIREAMLNATDRGPSTIVSQNCSSVGVDVVRTEQKIDDSGEYVFKVMYTVTCDAVPIPQPEDGGNSSYIWDAVDAILIHLGDGSQTVYRDHGTLYNVAQSYSLYLIGDIRSYMRQEIRQAILDAWQEGSTDVRNCSCNVSVHMVMTRRYEGIYGIQMTGYTYFISGGGSFLHPLVSRAPANNIFQMALGSKGVYNTVYSGKEAMIYDLHYPILLNSNLQKAEQSNIRARITATWEKHLPARFRVCQSCLLRITLGKPEIYYSTSGQAVANAIYFVSWGDQFVDPLRISSPTSQMLTSDGINACGCQGLRRRYVDFIGKLSYFQIQDVQTRIENAWRTRSEAVDIIFRGDEEFMDVLSNWVTRLYFTVSVRGVDASGEFLQYPISEEEFASELSRFEPDPAPTYRIYSLFIWDKTNDEEDQLRSSIIKSWIRTNSEVQQDDFNVTIIEREDGFIGGQNGAGVTEIRYTITILGADSTVANVEEPSVTVYNETLMQTSYHLCGCVPRKARVIYITGSTKDTDNQDLADVIATAWQTWNLDFTTTLTTDIITKTEGFQTIDGINLTRVVYTVTPDADRPSVRDTDLQEPDDSVLELHLHTVYPHLDIYAVNTTTARITTVITETSSTDQSTSTPLSSTTTSRTVITDAPTTEAITVTPRPTTTPTTTTTTTLTTSTTPAITTPPRTSFTATVYFRNWWKYLREYEVIDLLRYAIFATNAERGIGQDDIRMTVLGKWDNLDPAGRNVAELMYNASLPEGIVGPLLPATEQYLKEAIDIMRYPGVRRYSGPQPWRYNNHYDFYYRDGDSGDVNDITEKLRVAWFEKYPEYKTCGCEFTIHIPRRVKYLDSSGTIVTRYIYFVQVDGRLNDPVVRPGPTVFELNEYFEGSGGNDGVVTGDNLTTYDDHHVIYFKGNEGDTDKTIVGEVIKEALVNSTNVSRSCSSFEVNVVRTEQNLDSAGDKVFKVLYTVTCDRRTVPLPDDEKGNSSYIWDAVDEILNTAGDDHPTVYREGKTLFNTGFSYTLYLIGDVRSNLGKQIAQAILDAWKEGNPDIKTCACTVRAYTVVTRRYVGIYGIQTTGITYFISTDGVFIRLPVPADSVFQRTLKTNGVRNTVYSLKESRIYDLHYSVHLNSNLQKAEQSSLQTRITTIWESHLPARFRRCQSCSLDITMGKPETYYKSSGQAMASAVYFVNWGSRVVDPLQALSPTSQIFTSGGIDACGCQGLRRRFLDFKGKLTYSRIRDVQTKIENVWKTRIAAIDIVFRGDEEFLDIESNMVTRIYFTVSMNGADAEGRLLQYPISESVISELSPYDPIIIPTHRIYSIFIWHKSDEEDDQLMASLLKAWMTTNKEVSGNAFDVRLIGRDDGFIGGDSGAGVTEVRYIITILGADSSITNVDEPSVVVYNETLTQTSYHLCGCVPRKTREIYITGSTDDTDDQSLADIIATAWHEENPDFRTTLTTGIISKSNGFQKADGTKLTKVVYTVTPDAEKPSVRDTDLQVPTNSQLDTQLHTVYPDINTYDGDVEIEKVESRGWVIPVAIVVSLFCLVIIIIIVIFIVKTIRNRKSRTLKRRPEDIKGFDKEHFSAEPDFENPAFDADDIEQKENSQFVNM